MSFRSPRRPPQELSPPPEQPSSVTARSSRHVSAQAVSAPETIKAPDEVSRRTALSQIAVTAAGVLSARGLSGPIESATAAEKDPPSPSVAKTTPPAAKNAPVRARRHAKWGAVDIFPSDNPWNQRIDQRPVHPLSGQYLKSVGLAKPLHPDFGTIWNGAPSGIPFVVVGPDQPRVPVRFEYPDESDPGPYPLPLDAPIEGGPESEGDRHILVIDAAAKKLYETFSTHREGTGYRAGSGAVFDLTSNKLRPAGWTSADAAGLPIFPGLVRYDEVMEQGEIPHALRFTVRQTQRAYISPATHWASRSQDPHLPPMGLRVRLKADFNLSRFPKAAQVVLRCLQRYGMLLADNGGDWFISGAPDPRWDDEALSTIKRVKGSDLEVVQTGETVFDRRR